MEAKAVLIEAVKNAIMVELKGQQLYRSAMEQTKDPAAKLMFKALADDEDEHVQILQNQHKSLLETGKINLDLVEQPDIDEGAETVITEDFKKSVGRGVFELAVIGIGCDLEKRAISYYKEQAEKAEDDAAKQLFTWLSEWEVGHLEQLMELENTLKDEYWATQGFSPM